MHLILGKTFIGEPKQPEQLKFIPEPNWMATKALENLYPDLMKNMESDSISWKKWYEKDKAESEALPKYLVPKSEFEKLLFLRAIRPDRMV